ncbi:MULTISPECIES: 5,10-methenyltetrahydromethanopterin hydrogenase cofactor biosynthesis protein HmdB [Methanobrevibacter]|uniref:Biotin synthase n=1 Tax=Methanobrevibacter gottschalkii DSM 11977 TaxID=1122229 RepID=A0A3N5C194_9EURY|nr:MULTISPECIES: 5,10-methenyltetrahydromethanopterin hydrogenase cofactor biosynthesis protein HmdB [Methanobrevibacter]OEC95376.1 5,10-methenyltetrahydromethanopterin hydrogenase cofactor biosynthesis protein HmdB [Methanobrevibacter sp. A27]RPF53142.1 biotin synthase [Methanobrevibacter gottschalkii DSM 11977]
MIDDILNKAKLGKKLTDEEYLELLKIDNNDYLEKLFSIACYIRNSQSKEIKLTSTVHITNKCQIQPRCEYCGFAEKTSRTGYYDAFYKSNEEILNAIVSIQKAHIPRVSCSGGYGYKGRQAVNACKIVKENSNLEILINVGGDLTEKSVEELAKLGVDTVCCNLETINEDIFNERKPGDSLKQRILTCRRVSSAGIGLSSGLLLGIGESVEDRLKHLRYLSSFKTLEEIPIMGFNPYPDTAMADYPSFPLKEQLKIVAITRIMYPSIRITMPTPTVGPENVEFSLKAGANNLATVIADNYPLEVKGVGSPEYGNYTEVINVIEKLGLIPQTI